MNTVEWLTYLVSFDTTSRNSNLKLIEACEDWFCKHQVDCRKSFSVDQKKANLFATIPGNQGTLEGGLILSGHTDVVPVDHQVWSSDPFLATSRDERIYGRGTSDMKGFLAVILALAPTIQKLNLAYPVHFAFSYDEEVGCKGAPLLIADLQQAKIMPTACIVGEPTELKPVIAHKGIQVFRCKVRGRAAHSSLVLEGANAIEHAAKIISSIRALADKFKINGPFDQQFDVPFSTLSINKIAGGTALNIIPDLCEFYVELRHLPQEKATDVIDEINALVQTEIKAIQAEVKDCTIEWEKLAGVPSFESDKKSQLIDLISRVSRKEPYKVAYATEAGLFQEAGMDTIIWGPGSIKQAHGANEFISLKQLKQCEEDLVEILRGI